MKSIVDVVIIGAGPYGLSIAAYLKASGVEFRIFGRPMENWRMHMPKGMRLKSDGFASSLYDPEAEFPLAAYCKQEGLPYADIGLPIPLDTFTSYGLAFQRKFVPELEDKLVVSVRRLSPGFEVTLDDGDTVLASRVVSAVGLSHYAYVPAMLARVPEKFVSHSSKYGDVACFKGKEVAVVGAGASALDLAALLHQAGAIVQVVARSPDISFHDRGPIPRPLMSRIQRPTTGLGPGWRSFFCVNGPLLFRHFPEQFRLQVVRKHLGPAPGWFVKDEIAGKVPLNLGVHITGADVRNDRVSLQLADQAGARRTLEADHVIAGTGYRVDLRRLTFIDPAIQAEIKSVEHTPILSSKFESSVPGLYFVGITAANTFGPLLRFAYGAQFASRRISRHLAGSVFRVNAHADRTRQQANSNRDDNGCGSSPAASQKRERVETSGAVE